jgi:beta-aspartyl-peptidase (threonine type)
MNESDYVYLSGESVQLFAKKVDVAIESAEYFHADFRFKQWQKLQNSEKMELDHSSDGKFGTVGAVALDLHGNLAAATSTGGLTNKRYGRVGDSSVIGAGTYANNQTCAISCTGYGEFFLRGVVAHDISCLMEYKGLTLQQAAELVIMEKQVKLGGEGGIIGIDRLGNTSLVFNSKGMYRGTASSESERFEVQIYE